MPRLSLTHVLNMTRVFIWDSKPQKSVQCAKEKGSTSVSFPWFEFLGCAQWRLFERGIEAHHQGLTKSTSNISATLRLAQLHILLLQVDEFTGKLWEIYETIKSEGGPVQVKCWSSLWFLDLMQGMNVSLGECQECLKEKSLWTNQFKHFDTMKAWTLPWVKHLVRACVHLLWGNCADSDDCWSW